MALIGKSLVLRFVVVLFIIVFFFFFFRDRILFVALCLGSLDQVGLEFSLPLPP